MEGRTPVFLSSPTPCVYPMIVITVSIFGAKEAKSRWQGPRSASCRHRRALRLIGLRSRCPCAGARQCKRQPLDRRRHRAGLPRARCVDVRRSRSRSRRAFSRSSQASAASASRGVRARSRLRHRRGAVHGAVPRRPRRVHRHDAERRVGAAAMDDVRARSRDLFFVVGLFAISLPKAGAWTMGSAGSAASRSPTWRSRSSATRSPSGSRVRLAHPGTAYGATAAILTLAGLTASIHIAAERRRSKIQPLVPDEARLDHPGDRGIFMLVTWWNLPSILVPVADASTAAPGWGCACDEIYGHRRSRGAGRAASEHKPVPTIPARAGAKRAKSSATRRSPISRPRRGRAVRGDLGGCER